LSSSTASAIQKTNNQSQAPAAPVKGPKIGAPDKFDGTRGAKAEVFLNQVNLYTLANQHLFGNERAILVFILSYLTGQASSWAQPWMAKVMDPTAVIVTKDFNIQFTAMYCDTEKKTRAEAAIRALKQTKSVSHYTHQFNLHAHNTGWETATLVSQYRHGLKPQIRLMLLMARTKFPELADAANLALKIDNELNGIAPPEASSTPDPNAMDLSVMRGRLLDKEKTRMMRAGLCFQCGTQGHISKDCPERGQKGKGRERSRIAALEEEVKQLKAGGSKADSSKNGGAQE
jgi:hypothetical protein